MAKRKVPATDPYVVSIKVALELLRTAGNYGGYQSLATQKVNDLQKAAEQEKAALIKSPAGARYRAARRRADDFRHRFHRRENQIRHDVNELRASIKVNGVTPRNLARLKKLLGYSFKL